jgi:AcrR family transcriptional regulator
MRPSRRDELVSKALDIFYAEGFHATGMDRLVQKTGISKTSMYKYFRTKEDLILATLRLRDQQFRQWFQGQIEVLADTPEARLGVLFDVLAVWFSTPAFKGCLFIKAAAEFQNPGHPIHAQAADHKHQMFVYIRGLAQQAGRKRADALARQIQLLIEGAIVIARLGDARLAAKDGKEAAQTLLANP